MPTTLVHCKQIIHGQYKSVRSVLLHSQQTQIFTTHHPCRNSIEGFISKKIASPFFLAMCYTIKSNPISFFVQT